MKKLVLLLIVALAGNIVMAQQDQKAKDILDQVTSKTQTYKSIEANFSFEMENIEESIKETNNGSIILKGDKYKVKLNELGMEVYSDGTNIWTYMKEINEVTISEFNGESDDMMEPSKIFTMYQNGFNYKFVGESVKEGKSIYTIDLFPHEEDSAYKSIRVSIDKSMMLICCARMYNQDGNTYSVMVNDLKTDKEYEDSFFVFDKSKYPGIEEIDMR